MRPASSPRAATMVAACCGLCAAAPAGADSDLQSILRDTRADFGRADLRPAAHRDASLRAVGGVDPTIGNPNPWAGLIGENDIFEGFESYIPHASLVMADWVPLDGQTAPDGFAWSAAPDYHGVVDNTIAQTGPNWNPSGSGFDRHGVAGGPDPLGLRSRFFVSPRGTIEPQPIEPLGVKFAQRSHALRAPDFSTPLVILCDIYLDDITTLSWFRPVSFFENLVHTGVFMGGYGDGDFAPFVNGDGVLDRTVVFVRNNLVSRFYAAPEPHRTPVRSWFTVGVRRTSDRQFSVWVRDETTVGVYGFEQDSIHDDFPGDPSRGAFVGEIFERDWLQVYPGVEDDPATAPIEGLGHAKNSVGIDAIVFFDNTGSPTGLNSNLAVGVDGVQFLGGQDPDLAAVPGFQPHDWCADNYTVLGVPRCAADITANGVVDGEDLGLLLGAWGSNDAAADLNGDGVVDGADLGLLLGAWGDCP